ncbi:MAG: hypothetical protein H7240_10905 [Glaciimonas sp.]|nr:hypothetical protein [Glaciimonas sp.]
MTFDQIKDSSPVAHRFPRTFGRSSVVAVASLVIVLSAGLLYWRKYCSSRSPLCQGQPDQ